MLARLLGSAACKRLSGGALKAASTAPVGQGPSRCLCTVCCLPAASRCLLAKADHSAALLQTHCAANFSSQQRQISQPLDAQELSRELQERLEQLAARTNTDSEAASSGHTETGYEKKPEELSLATTNVDEFDKVDKEQATDPDGTGYSQLLAEELRKRHAILAKRRKSGREAGPSGRDAAAAAADSAEVEDADAEFDRLWRSRRLPLGVAAQTGQEVPIEEQRLLQVGVIGVPNAGKSTLTNLLVGSKVSAVSPKTNTTTVPTLGAFTVGASQVVMYDTPGVVDSRHLRPGSHQKRVRSAWSTASYCDLLLLIIDAHRQIERPDPRVLRLVEEMAAGKQLGQHPPPPILILNKVDKLTPREQGMLLKLESDLSARCSFEQVFYTSATKGSGMKELEEFLLSRATLGEWTMEPGWKTDMPPHKRALEVVREKLFLRLRQELPYEINLQDVSHREMADGSWRFDQMVWVASDQVKRIVVGKHGAVIGEVGIKARKELEALFQTRVHLFLTVKVA